LSHPGEGEATGTALAPSPAARTTYYQRRLSWPKDWRLELFSQNFFRATFCASLFLSILDAKNPFPLTD
jgi:hypothetical protein